MFVFCLVLGLFRKMEKVEAPGFVLSNEMALSKAMVLLCFFRSLEREPLIFVA